MRSRSKPCRVSTEVYDNLPCPNGVCNVVGGTPVPVTEGASTSADFVLDRLPASITSIVPSSGPTAGGTTVVIGGVTLTPTSGVTIGGVTATIVGTPTPTAVTVTTPAATTAGARDVVVSTPGGPLTAVGGFTYNVAAKVSDETAGANAPTLQPSLDEDGHYLAFLSLGSNLVAGDTNGVGDIFVRDRATGRSCA